MTAKLLGWTLAVTLLGAAVLVGCSATGSVATGPAARAATSSVSVTLDAERLAQTAARSAKFVGASVSQVNYTLTAATSNPNGAASASGSFALPSSTCPATGTNNSYSCTFSAFVGNYASLQVTLLSGTTPVGSATTAAAFSVASQQTTRLSLFVSPIFAAVQVSVPTGAFFGVDGTSQSIVATVTQQDPAGNIINLANGPVNNWSNVSLAASNTAVSLCTSAPQIATPAPTASGSVCTITYNGAAPAATSVAISATNATSPTPATASVTIPFVSLAASPNPIVLTDTTTWQTTFVTETNGGLIADSLVASTNPSPNPTTGPVFVGCGNHATFTRPLNSPIPNPAASPNAVQSFSVRANDGTLATCTLTITSVKDPNLKTTITINLPGQIQTQVQ